MRELCTDFEAECDDLARLLAELPNARWAETTQFEGWSVRDTVAHLHFWNRMALLAVRDPEELVRCVEVVQAGLARGEAFRAIERSLDNPPADRLCAVWRRGCADILTTYGALDPAHRVQWAGPDMSVRSAVSARLMETWAHAQAVYDLCGRERVHTDRVRHVVVLGVNTFDWSFRVRGRTAPGALPALRLRAPSGASWVFGEASETGSISGDAVAFAQVVTQTRHVDDTALEVRGQTATAWMRAAQCFAGPPVEPPPPGTRFRAEP
ncbi:MAG: TIGR03084 family metal-binding protein [Pseudomonadota bacterium]